MENYLTYAEEKLKSSVKRLLIKRIKRERRIFISDTTLRDGEQAPGAGLSINQKLIIARQLDRLGVDSIEAGFPVSSKEEFEATRFVSKKVTRPVITALCRSRKEDIDCAVEALKYAKRWGLGLFLVTSPILRRYSLGKTKKEILETIRDAVAYARKFTDNIVFGSEDSSRTEPEFLYEVYKVAIDAGAFVVSYADTVGCVIPDEVRDIISGIKSNVANLERAFLAVHFHDDLGVAVANTLAAIKNGVNIAQCTINGIGERAGNASLEEVVMALKTRNEFYKVKIGIDTRKLYKTSRLVSELTGLSLAPNKSIVGENVFATEAGIHQAALLKKRVTYEIIDPRDVGQQGTRIVLGRHSGKHAIQSRLRRLCRWRRLSPEMLDAIYTGFKDVAATKKEVREEELLDIAKSVLKKR